MSARLRGEDQLRAAQLNRPPSGWFCTGEQLDSWTVSHVDGLASLYLRDCPPVQLHRYKRHTLSDIFPRARTCMRALDARILARANTLTIRLPSDIRARIYMYACVFDAREYTVRFSTDEYYYYYRYFSDICQTLAQRL